MSQTLHPPPGEPGVGFLAKAGRVASGHAVGYGVALLVSPVLARVYGPDAFGMYAVFVLAVSSLTVVATLRFDQAIPVARSVPAAKLLTQLALAFAVAFAGAMATLIAATDELLAGRGRHALPELWIWLLADALLCLAVYQVAAGWLLRGGRYRDLAGMRVTFAVAMAVTQLSVACLGGSLALGLPAGQAAGFAAGAIYGAWRLRQGSSTLRRQPIRRWRLCIHRYRQFAVYGVPAALVANIGIHVPSLLLAALYSWEVAGMYALAQRVFTTPLTLLTNSFSRVFFAEAALQSSATDQAALLRTALRGGLLFAAVPIATVAFVAPISFGLVFGDEWHSAGWICTLLSPMVLALVLAQIVSPAFDVVGDQQQRLHQEMLCTGFVAGGLFAGWQLGWNPLGAIALASVGGSLGYLLLATTAVRCVTRERPASRRGQLPQRHAA